MEIYLAEIQRLKYKIEDLENEIEHLQILNGKYLARVDEYMEENIKLGCKLDNQAKIIDKLQDEIDRVKL